MTGNLNMAISLSNGEETGHYAYRVHNRPHSSVSHRPLTLPTVEELSKIVEYRKQAKDEGDALNKQFKELEAKL